MTKRILLDPISVHQLKSQYFLCNTQCSVTLKVCISRFNYYRIIKKYKCQKMKYIKISLLFLIITLVTPFHKSNIKVSIFLKKI